MKILPCYIPLFLLLSGCDSASIPVAFTPEMASFSNEFDFDPLRGPVRDFSQTLMNEKGEVTRRISGQMSEEGCFDLLELHDVENNTGATLVLNANYYIDAITQEKRILLQGKCQLAEMPAAGITWETDDNGFVVSARGHALKVKYRYDAEGYPLGTTSVIDDQTLQIASTPSKDVHKKLDYTAVSTLNDKTVGNVTQTCDYDHHDNPLNCALQVVDTSETPTVTRHYTVKNTIDYY